MLRRKDTDIPASDVVMDGAEGVKIRVILGAEDGAPNSVMRRFTIAPGGHTPYHAHDWEHGIYVLSGEGEARQGDRRFRMEPGTVILAEPGEMHNFSNTGEVPLDFLCVVPIV